MKWLDGKNGHHLVSCDKQEFYATKTEENGTDLGLVLCSQNDGTSRGK